MMRGAGSGPTRTGTVAETPGGGGAAGGGAGGQSSHTGILMLLLLMLSLVDLCGSNSWGIKCGWATIDPRKTLCCSGLIYIRSGINPACCGNVAYDAFYSYCCNGRIRRKTGFGRCCGQRTYDTRSSMCQDGNVRPQRRPGSTCCRRNNQWRCCSHGVGCCSGGSHRGGSYSPGSYDAGGYYAGSRDTQTSYARSQEDGSVDVPGFRPACCEIASTFAKSQCCSQITQKAGVMPSCCDTDRHRPTCCRTSSTSFVCCRSTYGTPRCCRSSSSRQDYYPYQPPTTQPPHHLVPVHPTPLPDAGSCCFSKYPRSSCCSALQPTPDRDTNRLPDHYPAGPSSVRTKPKCCTYRYTCCRIRDYSRHSRCCSRSSSGQKPMCCSTSNYIAPITTTTALPPQHRCYSCQLNGQDPIQPPPVLARPIGQSSLPSGRQQGGDTGGPGWARLSCCRSQYFHQCCRNALRLAGVYADCCKASDIRTDSSSSSTALQTYPSSYNGRPEQSSRREAVCSDQPYDVTYYMCCFGVIRRKLGTQPACCGSTVYDAASYKCCSGTIKRSCTETSQRRVQWTQYYSL